MSLARQREIELPFLAFCSIWALSELDDAHLQLGRAICFMQFTDSNPKVFQKHTYRYPPEIMASFLPLFGHPLAQSS